MDIYPRINIQSRLGVQELCESRGGRPGLSVLMSLTVSVDVKRHWTMLRHWSQFVLNMSTDIRGHEARSTAPPEQTQSFTLFIRRWATAGVLNRQAPTYALVHVNWKSQTLVTSRANVWHTSRNGWSAVLLLQLIYDTLVGIGSQRYCSCSWCMTHYWVGMGSQRYCSCSWCMTH